MKRFASLWLPHWPTDRWRWQRRAEAPAGPLVLASRGRHGLALTAVDAAAAAAGLAPGMTLADARAVAPDLTAAGTDLAADRSALTRLADWCGRYTPWTATDDTDGVIMDITGCAHLFGGEATLLSDLLARLSGFGLAALAAIADTPAAAWAWARHGGGGIVAPGGTRDALHALPVAALRLPEDTTAALHRVGLRRIGDLEAMARPPLAARFGEQVLTRLDRAFGRMAEPISPRRPPAPWRCRLAFPEAIGRREDLDEATKRLVGRLVVRLEQEEQGARWLHLTLYRVDGGVQHFAVGTSRPTRDPDHLARLFAEPLGTADPGFGVETMVLEAAAEPLGPRQLALDHGTSETDADLARLVDRLQNRLGRDSVVEITPVESHVPERAAALLPALSVKRSRGTVWPGLPARPARLLPRPEPIEAMAPVPDDPPMSFRWRRIRHRVTRADGPERIAPEWWRAAGPVRDYYRVEDTDGRRFWVYRDGLYNPEIPPRWYLHGLFP